MQSLYGPICRPVKTAGPFSKTGLNGMYTKTGQVSWTRWKTGPVHIPTGNLPGVLPFLKCWTRSDLRFEIKCADQNGLPLRLFRRKTRFIPDLFWVDHQNISDFWAFSLFERSWLQFNIFRLVDLISVKEILATKSIFQIFLFSKLTTFISNIRLSCLSPQHQYYLFQDSP